MAVPDTLAPANVDAEQAVLGSILIEPTAIVRVASSLRPDDFFRPAHARIYAAMLDLYGRREIIDTLTLRSELERAGALPAQSGPARCVSGARARGAECPRESRNSQAG